MTSSRPTRVFASPLRWHVGDRALQHLQQGLLYPFAGHIAGDRGVFTLAGDLVDLIDVDDAALGLFHIQVSLLQQPQQDVLHVFTHITRFGEGGGVSDGEGHIQHFSQGLGQQGLAATRGPDQQDVRFVQTGGRHIGFALAIPLPGKAFVVVVNSYRQHLFGIFLADNLQVEEAFDLLGFWDRGQGRQGFGRLFGGRDPPTSFGRRPTAMAVAMALGVNQLLVKDLVAEIDAFVADVDTRSRDEFSHLLLGFTAEGTLQVGVELGHRQGGSRRRSNRVIGSSA